MIEVLNQVTGGHAPLVLLLITGLVAVALAQALRRSRPALAQGAWGPRIGKYIGIVAQGWLLTALVLMTVWCLSLREVSGGAATAFDDIGLNDRLSPDDVATWSLGMMAAIIAISYSLGFVRKYFGGVPTAAGLDVLPDTPVETAVFALLVAPAAGIGEEIVYRGFLLGQLWGITDNAWLAALVSSAVFGSLHIYQGSWGVARTALIGLALATGVVVTGSLVPSILAHTFANMLSVTVRKPVVPGLKAAP